MKKALLQIIALATLASVTGCVCQIGRIETAETAPRATFWRSNDIGGNTNAVETAMEGGGSASAQVE